MSSQTAAQPIAREITDQEIDEVLAEFDGDVRAVIRALLHDQAALIEDAQQASSRGSLRGKFSEGARRPAVDDEP